MARRRKDMYWATRLAEAFRDDQFTLYAQPIRALAGAGTGLHYEVLLRMKNDGMAPIMPATFLPSAERFDIMTSVDRWVLDHSLAWLERHPEHVARLELCTINLSRRALADATFQRYVVALVEAGMTAPSKICFEITETGAIANMRTRLAFMRELKGLGCQFALDDFGTGTASFTYLKQLPVDYVKIDGSFIQGMATSHVDLEMVRFTNNISHFMGKKTIAEYVSNQATLDLLTELGVDYAQGFLVGKPAPLAA
jgi:EAL domain-containing protein (putative c-di-GMP-specific phosphodiesterase class I)